ncbi:hypothetical protein HID58_092432 [Brassica napus]|uniref:Uncharacterized protein n=1 Tax=Brassica napus TaxID=3708 RepID=A0ABQ7WWJ8_BRANA|nr:hypothetical protein HID58_092432 [Brassica napus]
MLPSKWSHSSTRLRLRRRKARKTTATASPRDLTKPRPLFKYWYLREAARMGVKQALRSINAFPRAE